MYILGFNCYVYNSAACLMRDGRLVAAAQEERFTRERYTGVFPLHAIRYCLSDAGITVDDLDHVCFHWKPFHQLHRRIGMIVRHLPDSLRYYDLHFGVWSNMVGVSKEFARRSGTRGRYRFHRVKHHIAHGASAFLASPYDSSAVLTLDGSGEMASTTIGVGKDSRVRLLMEINYPHSLGYLFVALTHYLGFKENSDEFKLMSLAPYGMSGKYYDEFRRIISLEEGGRFRFDLSYFNYHRGIRNPWVSRKFIDFFGPVRKKEETLEQRHADIAWALQKRLEDAVLHLAVHAHKLTKERNVCLAGGVALNATANATLLREGLFEGVFVQPAAFDAGTCIGAALHVAHAILQIPRDRAPFQPYLGPRYSGEELRGALGGAGLAYRYLNDEDLISKTASLLAEGKIIGWFQGRLEFGPRALGNRSILADPRRAEMRDRINETVKHREDFRPFAPAVLLEASDDYFESLPPSPFMTFVFRVRPEKREVIPAVTHIDGTARVQTVARNENPRFYDLIRSFGRQTGVPVLLNTSFNTMGEPIVCSPRDAVSCYLSTEMDGLVLGNYLSVRPEP